MGRTLATLAFALLAPVLVAASPLRAATDDADDADLLAIFHDNPDQIPAGLVSGLPVPVIYADYLEPVRKQLDKEALAKFSGDLVTDLPPAADAADGTIKIPENTTLSNLLAQNRKRAIRLMVRALTNFPDRNKWTILLACGKLDAAELAAPLEQIAQHDSSASHRAFALKAIAQRKQANADELLRAGLFDAELSVRLLCMEMLAEAGDTVGSVSAVMPCRPHNPFQFYFLESALKRALPQVDAPTFFRQPFAVRIGAFHGGAPELTQRYLELASSRAGEPYASMVLYLCGNERASTEALNTLVKVLLELGKKTYDHHSPQFQLQSDIVDVLQQSQPAQFARLHTLFKTNLREYTEDREALLTTLAYAFSLSSDPDLADDLIRVRELQTKNKDLLMGAAQALAHMRNAQAIPSLVHILSLQSDAYSLVAIQTLENLTGVETPGVPRPDPQTGKFKPHSTVDYVEAYRFWREWMKKLDHDLQFDTESKHFK